MSNVRFAKDYLRYRSKAITRHGLHSPFVYRLVDNIIYDFKSKNVYTQVEEVRRGLLNDSRVITVTDLGAGSRVNNDSRKRVSDIAKHALKSPRLAQVIYRLVADLQPKNIIELGTSLGVTSIYLQKAAPRAHVYTLEGCPEIANIARESFAKAGTKDIELIPGNFDDTFKALIDSLDHIDFVFVDGNHKKDATLNYFEWCLPKVHENTLLIFDDIHWSQGMKDAWAQVKAHPQVTVTVDLFWMGLVYFRKGQVREDFVIKI